MTRDAGGGESTALPPRPPGWDLWRQDDHGGVFLVESYLTEKAARAALERFEAQGHKQTYWVQLRNTQA